MCLNTLTLLGSGVYNEVVGELEPSPFRSAAMQSENGGSFLFTASLVKKITNVFLAVRPRISGAGKSYEL